MKRLLTLMLLLSAATLASPAGAQPDKTEALAKAKAKFEQEISKAEDALIASIDKTLMKAQSAGNKPLAEKLAYEREQFVNHRIIPTAIPIPTGTYLKQRAQAIAALQAVYVPVIKDFTKAKKEEEAEALDTALSGLLKTARGYGLGLPDLALRPPLVIENKATGLVLEAGGKDGGGYVIFAAKMGRRKPAQCWYLDRDDKGYTIVNAQSGKACFVSNVITSENTPRPMIGTGKLDPQKEIPDRYQLAVSELRREVVITSQIKGTKNGFVFTAAEKKQKGVTTYDLTLEKPESSPSANQRWIITEAK